MVWRTDLLVMATIDADKPSRAPSPACRCFSDPAKSGGVDSTPVSPKRDKRHRRIINFCHVRKNIGS
ncbi:hypothetical protein BD777DRAFT_123997 [Yarrowia lipolytica]|nr:hypothetical protein BD777DRAFT_123997 [Yarrowia lipolytica]